MNPHLNLLPFSLRRSSQRGRLLRRTVLLCGTTLLCCGSFGLMEHRRLEEIRSAADGLDRECAAVREAADDNHAIQGEIQAIEQRLGRWEQLEQADLPLSVLGLISAATNRSSAELQLDRIRVERIESTPNAPGSTPAGGPAASTPSAESVDTRIELSGTAASDASVGEYVNSLRALEVFSIVELVSTQRVQLSSLEARGFQIRCAF